MNLHDERTWTLKQRVDGWREDGFADADTERTILSRLAVPWRTYGVILQTVFFVLTCIGMAAGWGLLSVFKVPKPGLFAGIAFLVLAEVLIRAGRWFWTGVESALWMGGLLALISELPESGRPESLLVLASAFAISGARVRNPLLGAAAAVGVMAYAEKFDRGVIAGLAIALIAAVALLREWKRPSTEWLWIAIVLILPVASWFAADANWRTATIALYAILGVVTALLALTKRHHAYFLAAFIGFAIAGIEISKQIDAPLEARLAAWGALLMAVSFAAHRALRDRTRGFVLTPSRLTVADDAIQLVATAAAYRPEASAPQPKGPQAGGGGFGGGGATGDL